MSLLNLSFIAYSESQKYTQTAGHAGGIAEAKGCWGENGKFERGCDCEM